MLDYEVIKTGSSGNCVVIQGVMIDCGVPYSMIREYLYDIDYLLITHLHGDHLKLPTFRKIRKYFPSIIVISNWQVAQRVGGDVDYTIDWGESETIGDITFEAFEAIHDVVNNGYCWSDKDKDGNTYDIVYCTDSSSYEHIPDRKFDYLFLESNYDENIINGISAKEARKKYKYNVVQNAHRHASKQIAKGCYYTHRKDKESKLIEIHMSTRFYQ